MSESIVAENAERMSWDQICARYAGEWVLMVDMEWSEEFELEILSAVVVTHSVNRRDTRGRIKSMPEDVELAHIFIDKPEKQGCQGS